VTSVAYASEGGVFATCTESGDVMIWNGVSLSCHNTIARAHDGAPIRGAVFSRDTR
jgi:hypothetical protein